MAWFPTDTGRIYYEVHGAEGEETEPLTLLHNFMSTGRQAWGALLPDLSRSYRILLPDLPGHGRSEGHPPDFDHGAMARQLAALMAAEGALQGHLAGVSSGGMIALRMVHHGHAHPGTLTLVSTTYSNAPEVLGPTVRLTPDRFRAGRNWLEATARLHDPHHHPGYFQEVLLPAFRHLTPERTVDLSPEDLAGMAMPACIVHGAEDEFFPPHIPRTMAQALPRAELHLIPGQGHALIFRRPWQVRDILLDFLSRHPL